MATELVAFLRARLDDDERAARAERCRCGHGGYVHEPACGVRFCSCAEYVADDPFEYTDHRILADVAAKQAVLDAVFHYEAKIDGEWGDCCSAETIADGRCEYTPVDEIPALLALVQPYDGHAEFNPAWSVSAGVR